MSQRTRFVIQFTWIALLILGVATLVLSLPAEYAHLINSCSDPSCAQGQQLAPEQIEELGRLGLSVNDYAVFTIVLMLLSPLVFIAVAAVIFSRKADDRMALFCSFMLLTWGLGGQASGFTPPNPVLNALVLFFRAVGNVSIVLFFFLFPSGKFVPGWSRWIALAASVREVLDVYFPNFITDILFFAAALFILALQIYRYRRASNTAQRQQTKWVVAGTLAGVGGYTGLLFLGLVFLSPPGTPPDVIPMIGFTTALNLFLMFIPISIGVAVMRSHLWDIDILIRRTLIYGALTAMLALVYFGSVVLLQELLRTVTGQTSDFAIVGSTLLIAALFAPLRNAIQRLIDQRLYRRRYDAVRVLANFGITVRNEVDLPRLEEELIAVVSDTMQPASASLWLRTSETKRTRGEL